MIKIKICSRDQSDVTEMKAKGWLIRIMREANPHKTQVVAEKGNVQYVLSTIKEEGEVLVCLKTYVFGECTSTKQSPSDGCGVYGTLYISDNSIEERSYAFFRNEAIQSFMDFFGIRQVKYTEDAVMTESFSQTLQFENDTEDLGDRFVTDGFVTHNSIQNEDGVWSHSVSISYASYLYDKQSMTLSIPYRYDINKLYDIMYEYLGIERGSDTDVQN
jgi:hypothetical protein